MRYRILPRLALLVLFATFSAGASAQTPNGDALLRRLQGKYQSMQSLRAEFTQTMASDYGNDTFTGTLTMQGNRYRVEAGQQRFVTDGRTTWMHDTARNQVVINHYVEDETAFSPATFLTSSSTRYRVASVTPRSVRGERFYVLRLVPRTDAEFFEEVTITLRDRDTMVTQLDMRDLNGTQMRYELRNVQVNPRVAPGTFTYTPPRGVEVVDLRS